MPACLPDPQLSDHNAQARSPPGPRREPEDSWGQSLFCLWLDSPRPPCLGCRGRQISALRYGHAYAAVPSLWSVATAGAAVEIAACSELCALLTEGQPSIGQLNARVGLPATVVARLAGAVSVAVTGLEFCRCCCRKREQGEQSEGYASVKKRSSKRCKRTTRATKGLWGWKSR